MYHILDIVIPIIILTTIYIIEYTQPIKYGNEIFIYLLIVFVL